MGVTARLIYDPSAASSSHSIGAHVLAGNDGDQIASQTISAEEWLNTAAALHDGSGNAITSTSSALDVNIASGSLTVTAGAEKAEDAVVADGATGNYVLTEREDTLSTTTSADGDYQSFKTNSTGALWVDASAFDVNVNLQAGNGTDITETSGALDVNIASGDIDDSLADTAIENTTTAVSTVAVAIVSSALANRKWTYLANEGNKSLFYGKSGVTVANGFPLHPGGKAELRIGPTPVVQIIGETGASSEDLRVMELS